MKYCCGCLQLRQAVNLIGLVFFTISLVLFVAYLVFIEDIRTGLLNDHFGIPPCEMPLLDVLVDSLVEYSLASNLLLLFGGASRWLLLPWLYIYALNMVAMLGFFVFLLVSPIASGTMISGDSTINYVVALGLLLLMTLFLYAWAIIRARFDEMSLEEQKSSTQFCRVSNGFFVQCVGGIFAISSALLLLGYYAKLDDVIIRKLAQMTKITSFNFKPIVSSFIISSIAINLMLIAGGSGSKWRRCLLVPWLIFYGLLVLFCLGTHQWFTTLCWVEEKIYGLISLCFGIILLCLWTLVWIVAAEASEAEEVQTTTFTNTKLSNFHRL